MNWESSINLVPANACSEPQNPWNFSITQGQPRPNKRPINAEIHHADYLHHRCLTQKYRKSPPHRHQRARRGADAARVIVSHARR